MLRFILGLLIIQSFLSPSSSTKVLPLQFISVCFFEYIILNLYHMYRIIVLNILKAATWIYHSITSLKFHPFLFIFHSFWEATDSCREYSGQVV